MLKKIISIDSDNNAKNQNKISIGQKIEIMFWFRISLTAWKYINEILTLVQVT